MLATMIKRTINQLFLKIATDGASLIFGLTRHHYDVTSLNKLCNQNFLKIPTLTRLQKKTKKYIKNLNIFKNIDSGNQFDCE